MSRDSRYESCDLGIKLDTMHLIVYLPDKNSRTHTQHDDSSLQSDTPDIFRRAREFLLSDNNLLDRLDSLRNARTLLVILSHAERGIKIYLR